MMMKRAKYLKERIGLQGNNKLLSWLLSGAVLLCMCGSVFAHIDMSAETEATARWQEGSELSVIVSSAGCSPSSATKPAGLITLKVVNQTGEPDLLIQLYDSRNVLLREANMGQGVAEWSETFDLKAGSYTLKAGNNQAWTVQLTVQ